ncbi:hypothetical protein Zmor_013851 [Zophobas morio]|uniref:Zinc finger PHD-type domain-containing protein n=1 Tax=Zophobas morio TaxID=2755281 RepID=A0AA38IDT4_9CUCU|nr:hypothetical protein Zmor_013851 [Zophobas morio]
MPDVCIICSKGYSTTDSIACDIGNHFIHVTCAGLSRQEADCLRSGKRKINFFCDKCNIVNIIGTLKSEIVSLRNELGNLKSKLESQGASANLDDNKKLSDEEIINECVERQTRSFNIIVFNLPESSEPSLSDRKQDDQDKFLNFYEEENRENLSIKGSVRLGKFETRKIRPLKVTFDSTDQVLLALRKHKRTTGIYFNRDLTPMQQNLSYKIRKEFRERIDNGDSNIKMVYNNGIPKIVTKDKKNF